ncbi:MAG: low-density lipoprotein receptor class A repeat-containing protein, partial [Candidatus Poseidoniia archaeon]
MKRVFMLLVSASLLFAGCILDPQGIDDGGVIVIDGGGSDASAMSGAQVEAFLNDETNMNITALAEVEDKITIELYSKDLEDGELLEMTFTIGKDDISQLSNTGLAIQSGMMGLEYRVIQGASTDVNIMVGNQWFHARDLVPEYNDPFVELASEDDSDDGSDGGLADLTPDFGILDLDLSGMDWIVTVDVPSTQQVATSSNDTHGIMVEFLEFPPRLHQLEVNSHDGNQATKLTIVWGDDAALSVQNNYPKTSVDIQLDEETERGDIEGEFTCDNSDTVPWSYVNDNWDHCGDNSDEGVDESEIPDSIFEFSGEVNSDHEH